MTHADSQRCSGLMCCEGRTAGRGQMKELVTPNEHSPSFFFFFQNDILANQLVMLQVIQFSQSTQLKL